MQSEEGADMRARQLLQTTGKGKEGSGKVDGTFAEAVIFAAGWMRISGSAREEVDD